MLSTSSPEKKHLQLLLSRVVWWRLVWVSATVLEWKLEPHYPVLQSLPLRELEIHINQIQLPAFIYLHQGWYSTTHVYKMNNTDNKDISSILCSLSFLKQSKQTSKIDILLDVKIMPLTTTCKLHKFFVITYKMGGKKERKKAVWNVHLSLMLHFWSCINQKWITI